MKDDGSVKSIRSCLVAYVKQAYERRVRHIRKMEKLENLKSERLLRG